MSKADTAQANTAQSGVRHFRLPDVGEGLVDAEILQWHVKPGDEVAVNQVICEVETAKAAVELPCPWAGTVRELLVPEGRTVDVGTAIISVATGEDDADAGADTEVREKPLVGYGEKAASTQRRPRRRPGAAQGAGAAPAAASGQAPPEPAPAPAPAAPAAPA
ncbi:2-oxo acid dehydrogenase subunit E2, partial [Streptomonospora sp. S1-112]|nr:2-oxo acid dehydrogenase subunit E2 [Streptomonospora mangrovi]